MLKVFLELLKKTPFCKKVGLKQNPSIYQGSFRIELPLTEGLKYYSHWDSILDNTEKMIIILTSILTSNLPRTRKRMQNSCDHASKNT